MRPTWWFTVLYLCLIGWRLGEPTAQIYDEALFIKSAHQFLGLNGFLTWDHPPLGPLISALFILLFGDSSTVWRLPSFLAGLGTGLLCLDIVRRLGGSRTQQACVAVMLLCDGLFFTMARIGIPNALMVFFGMAALWRTVVHFWSGESTRRAAMAQAAALLGLACATKWAAVAMAAPIAAIIVVATTRGRGAPLRLRHVAQMFCVVPVAVYLSSFLIVPFLPGFSWSSPLVLQYDMLVHHLNHVCNHRYLSDWKGWPLLVRPIWFYFHRDQAADLNFGVLCLGNPAVFFLTLCAGIWALYHWMKHRSVIAMLVLVGYFSNWLLWAPVPRTTYFHYIYPAQIFGSIACGALVGELFNSGGRVRRLGAALCLLSVVALFIYFYPLYTALPVETETFFKKMWRASWI